MVHKVLLLPRQTYHGSHEGLLRHGRRLTTTQIRLVFVLTPPQAHVTPTRGRPRFPFRPCPARSRRIVTRT